nr:MAG TPA: hypothetical protein [Caudoviricetes sp.]
MDILSLFCWVNPKLRSLSTAKTTKKCLYKDLHILQITHKNNPFLTNISI